VMNSFLNLICLTYYNLLSLSSAVYHKCQTKSLSFHSFLKALTQLTMEEIKDKRNISFLYFKKEI